MKKIYKQKTIKNPTIFTHDELNEMENFRKYLHSNSTTKRMSQKVKNYYDTTIYHMPYTSNEEEHVNFKKFTETGDLKIILEMIKNGGLINSLFLESIINLAKLKYSESIYEGDKDKKKMINNFFNNIGKALRGNNKRPGNMARLIYHLKKHLDKQGEYPWLYSEVFIKYLYKNQKETVARGYANQIKKLEGEKSKLEKKIKTRGKKVSSIDSSFEENNYLKQTKLPELRKEINKFKKLQKSSGHKEAKKRTLEELYKITKIRIGQRQFDDLMIYVNKVCSPKPLPGVLIPW